MLYLVRKIGESIIINDNIEVKVVEVKGKTVRLGFQFPPTVSVLRKEIHERVVAENIAASLSDAIGDNDFTDALSKLGAKDSDKDKK